MRFGLVFSVLSAVACSESGVKKVNATPEAYITSHATGDTVDEGSTETVMGQVADADHALSELTTAWLYNGDPVCPDSAPDEAGAVSCDVTFTTDGGDVNLTVRDPDGETASTRVTLDVQPTDAPSATIASPTADGVYYSDTLITFEATVVDAEDAADTLTVQWSSELAGDLDGEFNTPDSEGKLLGATLLDEGEHFITLTVTDSTGKAGSDSVVVTVGPPNSAPTCAITAPEDLSAGPEGELVLFEATVSDPDVPANMLTVEWTSDKDGPIGTSTADSEGAVAFPFEDLTVNTHVITMTATDEMDANCAANVIYTVGTPPVLNVTAPADGVTLNHSDAVVFEATVTDNEDLPNEVALSWVSDVDGEFSTAGADSAGAATVSIGTLSAGDHVVTVTATDTDGLFVTDTVSFNLNQPPTVPTVTLEPDPAATNQMLVATASGSEDPEGTGTVTYTYAWFEDGTPSAESASATFPASATGKNHTYRVQVTASDGLVDSAFGYAEVNVINSDPVLSGPTLSSATAVVGDVLTCTASATDIDPEDSPTVTYAWSDGSTGPTYTVTMTDAVDAVITCTVTADDADGGVVTGTASATVTNTAPTVDTVTVTPAEASVGDELTCAATASDADGDTPTIAYAWSDGSTGTTSTVPDTAVTGDVITCTATATDDRGVTGSATASATVTNTAPTITAVTIGPDPAYNNDTLVCTATATDPDGDTPTIAYEWTGGATGPELPLTSIIAAPYDTFTCTATATDGDLSSDPMSELVIIANRDPVVTATLTPASPTKLSTLTCTASDVSDPDDDATTVAFGWTINDAPAVAATTDAESILSDSIDRGDTVACTVTVTDSSGGTATRTATATIGNSAPVVSDVTLSPSAVYTNDVITASATITDAEESADELDVTYRFFVGVDMVQESSSNTLNGAVHFDKGDDVYVAVMADDGLVTHTESSDTLTVLNSPPSAPDISISASDGAPCEDGWTLMDDGTRCMIVVENTGANWADAQANCEAEGGDLIRISSEADNELVVSLSSELSDTKEYIWIGYSDTAEEGVWVWADGGAASYENWEEMGAPSPDGGAAENCAQVYYRESFQYLWNDMNCEGDAGLGGYACQTEIDGLTCTIDEESTDADGDPITYTFDWDVDGESYTDTETTTHDGDTVPADALGSDETWTCEVTPDDGGDEGSAATASLYRESGPFWDTTTALGDAHYEFIGETSDYLGTSVASAGDVDGDGLNDILIGATGARSGTGDRRGAVYLVLASSLGADRSIVLDARWDLSVADYTFIEGHSSYAGSSIASAGDVDGDGRSDLLIGANGWGPGSLTRNGRVYLILASSLGADRTIDLDDADYTFIGITPDAMAGTSVASAGDVDGDGLSDILIGSYGYDSFTGRAHLVLASSLTTEREIDLNDADYTFVPEVRHAALGESVASAGDVDGDGLSDILLGTRHNSEGCSYLYDDRYPNCYAGKGHLILGASLGGDDSIDLADADYAFLGNRHSGRVGHSVSSAGDIDGDGLDDIMLGGRDNYESYVVLAASLTDSPIMNLTPDADYIFESSDGSPAMGRQVGSAGDVNGDGLDDLIISELQNDEAGENAGKVSIVLSSSLGSSRRVPLSLADYSFLGEHPGDEAGHSVANAGDVDGDGLDDLLIGAYSNSEGGHYAGKVWLMLTGS